MINDPKPYGVGAGRLWLESHMSKLDPKIGDPYATQVVKEIDAYVERAVLQARSQAFEESAKIADDLAAEASASQEQAFDQGNDVKGNMFWSSHTACLTVSQAIRQHSQKGEDNE